MESIFIEWLRNRIPDDPRVAIGLGDDAALLSPFDGRLVVTSDLLADGVHFEAGQDPLRKIGRKALAVNLSDLAAMGAKPLAATVSVLLPRASALEVGQEIYHGLLPLAHEYQISIVGGDTNTWDGNLVISVTALGSSPDQTLQRDGAKVGDYILVSGPLGGSILGKHFTFPPRIDAGQQLAKLDVHAVCDISDGLLLDLSRILAESSRAHGDQLGAELTLSAVPISDAAVALSKTTNRAALDHAISDGEDFELLVVTPAATAQHLADGERFNGGNCNLVDYHIIGRVVEEPGLWGISTSGDRHRLASEGYQH